jgi:hypothetical protein
MLKVGLQLATWFPVIVTPIVTLAAEFIAILVYSVTPTKPVTMVASPAE